MQIIRKSSFVVTPWKNGGGITHEALRVPKLGDPFDWRVSMAQIETAGSFSDFSGYHRVMVLLRGGGMQLSFSDQRREYLQKTGDLVEFDGAMAPQCDLVAGPCVDLNLMVAKTRYTVRACVKILHEDQVVTSMAHETCMVLSIDSDVSVSHEAGETIVLNPWDLMVLEPNEWQELRPISHKNVALVFHAALSKI